MATPAARIDLLTLPRDTRLECRICWQVYDPAEGDPVAWQIPRGTPFADLPAHWTCPTCAATKDQFLLLDDETPAVAAPLALHPDRSARLEEAFRAAATRMQGLSIVNPALAVEAVGFAPWAGCWLGVLVTPWFMNLVLTPREPTRWRVVAQGETLRHPFPAGDYDFIGAHDDLAGDYLLCSLFSPMQAFEDQAAARLVAQLAREALFDEAHAEPVEMPVANLSPDGGVEPAPRPGPLARLEAQLDAPVSKRDLLHGRLPGDDRGKRR